MKIKTLLLFFSLMSFIIISCSTFKVRRYEFNPIVNCMDCSYSEFIQKLEESGHRYDYRNITLLNDSILMYGKLYGRRN
jgi:hypothetical protein